MSAQLCIDALKRGHKILVCGNGGSAAQAAHFVTELVVRYKTNRPPLAALNLTADTAILTAIANDFGFEQVFSRQVEAFGQRGDVLIALSTSGKSANVLRAIKAASARQMVVIDFSSVGGEDTARKQEAHLEELHVWAQAIEEAFS